MCACNCVCARMRTRACCPTRVNAARARMHTRAHACLCRCIERADAVLHTNAPLQSGVRTAAGFRYRRHHRVLRRTVNNSSFRRPRLSPASVASRCLRRCRVYYSEADVVSNYVSCKASHLTNASFSLCVHDRRDDMGKPTDTQPSS